MKPKYNRYLVLNLLVIIILIYFYVETEWDSCEIQLTINGRNNDVDKIYFFATEVGQKKSLIMNWYYVAIVVPSFFYSEMKSYEGNSLIAKRQRKENKLIVTSIVKWIQGQQEYGVIICLNGEFYKRSFSNDELSSLSNGLFSSSLKLTIDFSSLIKLDKNNWTKDYVFAREPPVIRIVSPKESTKL